MITAANIAGTYALVTGASSGIGRAICTALAAHGAKVLLVGRHAERTVSARDELTAHTVHAAHNVHAAHDAPAAQTNSSVNHHAVCGDLTSTAFIAALAAQALEWSRGQLGILVHCAGQHEPARIEQTSVASFDAAIATNLRAPFLLTAALLPALRSNHGHVVLVNSSVVMNPRAGTSAYAASKAGLRMFADCLRAEVSGEGIRVLSIFPGRTATPMQRERYEGEGQAYRPERLLQPQDVAKEVLNAICARAEVTELHLRPLYKD